MKRKRNFIASFKKKAFTLIEIVLVIVIVSWTLLAIVVYVQSSLKKVRFANHKIIALNLAKEGMESMYYARNASVLAHSWVDRNKCWLALDSSRCPSSNNILGSGYYTIQYGTVNWVQKISFKKPLYNSENIPITFQWWDNTYSIISNKNTPYALYLSGNIWTTNSGGKIDNVNRYWRFFRQIQGMGIYQKTNDGDTSLKCNGSYNSTSSCNDDTPKEYRFCSIVKYIGLGSSPQEEKICGVMTNFFPATDNF